MQFAEFLISKFSPTMVDDYRSILSHFRRENLQIFSNHVGQIQGHSQPFQEGKSQNFLRPRWMIIGPFSAISEGQISNFFNHVGQLQGILSHLRKENLKIFSHRGGWLQGHSQSFEKGRSQNFLRSWRIIIWPFSAISEE